MPNCSSMAVFFVNGIPCKETNAGHSEEKERGQNRPAGRFNTRSLKDWRCCLNKYENLLMRGKRGKDNLHGWKKPILPLCDQTSACTCKVHVASGKLLSLRQHICFKSTHHQNKCQKLTFLQTTYTLNCRFLYVWLDSKCYLVHNHSRKYRGLDLSPKTQLRCFDFSSIISNLYCHKQGWKFVSRSLRNFQRCHNCWNTLVHCHKISSCVTSTDIETQSQTVVSGSETFSLNSNIIIRS